VKQPMQNIVIKTADVNHIPVIQALYSEYAPKTFSFEEIKKCLTGWPSAVVFDGEEAIGFGYSTRFAPDILELCNLFVKRAYRSLGVGAKLIKFIEDRSRADFSGIVLVNSFTHATHETKRSAKNFYLKNGYKLILSTGKSEVFGKTW